MNGTKLPLVLRTSILLLRLTLGIDFIFNPLFGGNIGVRSVTQINSLFGTTINPSAFQEISSWLFVAIGACLVAGLLVRFISLLGIVLTLMSYLPHVTLSAFEFTQLATDTVLVMVCLLLLFFAKAGEYMGLDTFIHVHFFKKADHK